MGSTNGYTPLDMEKKIQAGIIGATGYAGAELVRLLLLHPVAEISAVSSVSYEGKKLSEIYPNFREICDMVLTNEDTVIACSDIVFACLPHGLSEPLGKKCLEQGKILVDLGADFRLEEEALYKQWYQRDFSDSAIHADSVYALCELFSEQIQGAKIIANPGCYPTSIALALAPALKNGLCQGPFIIDSKSGVTGAGRGLSQTTHYPDCNEAFSPYKVACHRHTPEIEQTLSHMAGRDIKITFVPHLLPLNRGIISTCYSSLSKNISLEQIYTLYKEFYKTKKFVRVLELGETANLKNVKYTNYCDISLHIDERTNTFIVVSTIDNMVKGAAGQAVQNMNLVFNLPEDTGLQYVPPAF